MLQSQKKLSNSFYALLALPSTAMGFALTVQIAALSWILSTQYGLDISDIGLVWATGPIAGIIGQVAIGIISDKVWFWDGRRRPFIIIGGTLAAMMILALPNLGIIQASMGLPGILGIAIMVSMILDLSINISFNPTRSIIADVTPEGRTRTKGYTWMQTVSGSFGVLAYFIGGIYGNIFLLYFGVFLVLVFSIIPPFFIKEPKYLGQYGREDEEPVRSAAHLTTGLDQKRDEASLIEIFKTIRPLWGFLFYTPYAILARLFPAFAIPYYLFEISMLLLTFYLIAEALMQNEEGKSVEEAGLIGFRKVLAAHSFTWVGVQTMFIYLYAFVDFSIEGITADQLGAVVNWAFFSLSLVAAVLPALVLEPCANSIGRVKTHAASIGIMAVGYAGLVVMGNTAFLIYFWMVVIGVGWASTISLPFAIMSQKISQARMGLYMGLFNLSVVLPQIIASFGIGEYLGDVEDMRIIFVICAITVGISAIAWSFVKEPVDRLTENPVLKEDEDESNLLIVEEKPASFPA